MGNVFIRQHPHKRADFLLSIYFIVIIYKFVLHFVLLTVHINISTEIIFYVEPNFTFQVGSNNFERSHPYIGIIVFCFVIINVSIAHFMSVRYTFQSKLCLSKDHSNKYFKRYNFLLNNDCIECDGKIEHFSKR